MSKILMCPENLLNQDLSGKTYVVTGGNSGIGFVTVSQLAKQGAHVIMACRRLDEAERAKDALFSKDMKGKLTVMHLDLASLESVREFSKSFREKFESLHGLVNNAGVMFTPRGKTKDGFETQFGTNHLGHFLLTELLLPVLEKTPKSRVVILSSCYHDKAQGREGYIDFDDLHFEKRKYDGWSAYAQSKLANLLHAKHLAKMTAAKGVTVVSVHPGWVRTNLVRSWMPVWVQNTLLRPVLQIAGMIEPWQGTQTSLYALLAPEVEKQSGSYFSQTGFYRKKEATRGGWPLHSPNPNAHDDAVAEKLYSVSRKLVGLA
ncbi:MAG: hypothetical protein RI932_1474 [Pseudomonadota bacterium]|jgi:light-dependent protochlorophyllide reductase